MKKKVLYGVFMALFAVLSMSTLQSCKDDLSDVTKKLDYTTEQLLDKIEKLQAQANQCQQTCQTEIADLKARVANNETSLNELAGQIKNLVTAEKLQQDLNNLEAALKANAADQIAAAIATVNARIDAFDADYKAKFDKLNADYDKLFTDYADLAVKLNTQESVVNALQSEFNGLKADTDSINSVLSEVSNGLKEVESSLGELWEGVFGEGGLQTQMSMIYNALLNDVDNVRVELKEQIDQINTSIESLEERYDSLTFRLQNLVTSIIIQGTDNPIFGNFSLPLGIQSNMLFNWYGVNQGLDFDFPTSYAEYSFDGESSLTSADLAFLGVSKENIPNGYFCGDISLGKVYLTVNPIGHDFDKENFTLETSAGKALPYNLKISPSKDEIYFGYSRSEDNGFYEANVIMPGNAQAIDATRIVIEEGLKTSVKDILKDRSKRNAINLLKALYNQMSGMLPAYGVRYDKYFMDRSSYSILSKYELAVATAKPLSYKFLYGKTIDKRLRHFGNINNLFADLIDKDKFKFELNTDFTIDKFTINFDDLTFDFSINPDVQFDQNIVVSVNVKEQKANVYDENGAYIGEAIVPAQTVDAVITPGHLEPLIDAITEAFQKAIGDMSVELGDQINEQIREKLIAGIQDQVNNMLDDIQSQINKMLSDLENQINGQISDMIDDVTSSIENKFEPIFERVNKMIDIYNKVADKINKFLEEPNSYLQPVIFYKNNGGIGILSNVKNDPTVLVKAGGNAFSFYLSSYTAEVVAPAAKKFVAVTNVYDADGNSVLSANAADVKAINAKSANFNKVLPGNTIRAAVATSDMKAGLTYEIAYQGLDYSGVTSTQKFYIKVK